MSKLSDLVRPAHPERVCWGCDRYCPADDLVCGADTVRSPHPIELFGDDWQEWSGSCEGSLAGESQAAAALALALDE